VLSADLLPNSTLLETCLRQPGHLLTQTRGFASPPFDGVAFIGLYAIEKMLAEVISLHARSTQERITS
jgi:hypothetical protein